MEVFRVINLSFDDNLTLNWKLWHRWRGWRNAATWNTTLIATNFRFLWSCHWFPVSTSFSLRIETSGSERRDCSGNIQKIVYEYFGRFSGLLSSFTISKLQFENCGIRSSSRGRHEDCADIWVNNIRCFNSSSSVCQWPILRNEAKKTSSTILNAWDWISILHFTVL